MNATINTSEFRRILGHYPTGVCAITSMASSVPTAMTVGSFTSVSLDPPLVAFFPDRKSTTWPKIEASRRFCVNVLAHHQENVCRALAVKGGNKFEGLSYRLLSSGVPVIDDVIAWIDCDLYAVHEAGDHLIAVGRVQSLQIEKPELPLLFFKGSYGSFSAFQEAVCQAKP